jgi:hypothetical protein
VDLRGDTGVPDYRRTAVKENADDGGIAVHEWISSDQRHLHDHPYDCVSIILRGGYWEVTAEGRIWREKGDIIFRRAEQAHRVELDPEQPKPISLFISGPQIRAFGFHTDKGWVAAKPYREQQAKPT